MTIEKIKFKRGPEARVPLLDEGEPCIANDTEKFLIGFPSGNVELAKQSAVDAHTVALGTKANQSDLNTTNTNVSLNTSQLTDNATSITRLNSITNTPTHLKDGFGADLSGVASSTTALTNALNSSKIIQLPSVCTVLIDQTFILNTATTIQGFGRNSVIKLGANVTLFDIQASGIKLKNLRIIVPDANTAPVLKITPQAAQTLKYSDIDIWIETEGTQGNWIGIQWDLSVGFLLYRNKFHVTMGYPKVGLDVIGNGGATGNDFDCEIYGFETAINLNVSASFQNNRFRGEIEDFRTVNTTGVNMPSNGWGNTFNFNMWYDSETGKFTDYNFGSTTYSNIVNGHMEGDYVDNGNNIFNATFYKWDFSVTPRSSAGPGEYRDFLNNESSSPINLLKNSSFSIGNNAGWIGTSDVTLGRDTATFGYTVMKLTSSTTNIGYAYQDIPELDQYKGKTIHLGCWVFVSSTATGNRVSSISIQDGITASYSDLVVTKGQWTWVTIKHKVSNSATVLWAELGRVNSTLGKTATVNDVVYMSKPVMLMGGRLRPQQHMPEIRLLKYTPPTSADSGKVGDKCFDDSYLYVWTTDNGVKRVALATW